MSKPIGELTMALADKGLQAEKAPNVSFGSGNAGSSRLRVGVILASLGRPEDLDHILSHLGAQTQEPALIILSLEKPEDAPQNIPEGVEVLYGPRGLCAQRNRGLEAISGRCDIVVFYDDDFVPSRFAIKGVADIFERHLDVAGATGRVLADGVTTGGVAYEEARLIVEVFDNYRPEASLHIKDVPSAYGCNMAFRSSAIADLRFDERLPLYGWQEDVDYAGRVLKKGRMVETDSFAGVHCGVSKSRMPGRRLGFSQIVNPIYLVRKGSMRGSHAFRLIIQNMIANHVRSLAPEAHVDRLGRAIGNWIGLGHVLRGGNDPMAVLQLDPGGAKPVAAAPAPSQSR